MQKKLSNFNLEIRVTLPDWVEGFIAQQPNCSSDEDKMRLAILLARENVLRETGGPFGAVLFQEPGAELVAVGVNSVERLNNAIAHAEILAIMIAERGRGSYSLRASADRELVLYTTCEPCPMSLGAILWSGLSRVVCAAGRRDALDLGFEEGPVFPESYRYLEDRGVQIVRGLLAEEARGVLRLYRERGARVYNG